uniref:Uncharacterized protein n=1 Tax=Haptolina brevifila TaxID=156173 RepID=A0A7S2JNC0_9EUKA|mmetsp:Transcript_86170/g.172096  ORF Transcript_86170/g.172096 Transcript_86170/m.172096 type:complete len:144 (+) Transcript_86170:82-513(+)|eukprot:CAMPEP_0174716926 /NCGR_PEP_ID=MMETSP1094-20130205/25312_1 /TAXON_ID=156173 /ORGANISM="Chrysochromulina brevifilum, Strain UTEX LB 985" /LENGTH=143 /DNA_ID=CAMNT_0015916795 /DNA_START=79 /DNA_END=510 /DNA_ORIENTATION=+
MWLLALQLTSFVPTGPLLPTFHGSAQLSRPATQHVQMIRPSGNSDPNFDPDAVSPEASRRTLIGQGVVLGVVASIGLLVSSSGKFDNASPPGFADAAAKKEAKSKAYLEELKEREATLAARTAAARAAGVAVTAPPKPWEKRE